MAQHDVKVDSMAKVVTALGVVLLLIVVGYMAKSLMNTIERGSTKGQVMTAPAAPATPVAEVPAAAAPAAAPAAAAAASDAAAGQAKYATCAACHGANGEGSGVFPKLAGLSASDVEGKLKKYRAGEQVGPMTSMMAPNAANLSDADIANLAAHSASVGGAAATPAAPAAAAAGDVAAGKAKYATCAACHGANGEGQGMFPKVAGQSAADLAAKLKKYRAGETVGPNSAMMAPNAAALSDGDIADLSAYLASL
ncbi:MAG: c-type cytochrome [Gammaproteobacteria bacterium]|nr:c-type cytochrome [Gammaproteobacteria bacterium]